MKSKYKSKKVTYEKECKIVRMYQKELLIKDIVAAVNLSRQTITAVLDAHGIRRPYIPAQAKKRRLKTKDSSGTIIQQCVAGMNERHKRINELFRPTTAA